MTLRPATPKDERRLWCWRNHPSARAASVQSDLIPWETHRKWFRTHSHHIWIIMQGRVACGVIREEDCHQVSIFIDPRFRGRGVSAAALIQFGQPGLLACIRSDNSASQRAFVGAGYKRLEGQWLWYRKQ